MPADSSPLPGSRRRYSSTTTETLSGITSGGSSTLLNDAGNSMNNLGGDCTTSSSNNNNSNNNGGKSRPSKIYDDPITTQGYQMVPMIEVDNLPRGGISFETKAVGRIQFGIPPETIKDSMILGYQVPSVYIVPVERFCREMGPALGINLAEFEFPAYFNFFVRQKRCTLIVDSGEAEEDIRNVFGETLLGPEVFRNRNYPIENLDEDFDPSFPKEQRPNFYKEFLNFRVNEATDSSPELSIDTLVEFCHFQGRDSELRKHDQLGVPPTPPPELIPQDSGELESKKDVRRRKSAMAMAASDEEQLGAISEDDDCLETSKEFQPEPGASASAPKAAVEELPKVPAFTKTIPTKQSSMKARRGSFKGRRSSFQLKDLEKAKEALGGIESVVMSPNSTSSRRGSFVSVNSEVTNWTNSLSLFEFMNEEEIDQQNSSWMYSQPKWLGEVATVYPSNATEEQKRNNSVPRVEIFKMAGGTEYIIHDVDENNIIVGKARFSGTVRVPDELSVEGFVANDKPSEISTLRESVPTFYPPSFGVTVLGNSHGFDKNGSTSGYVLWINGRGIMVDPPPFSSATLEREGIRPQTIIAIILTHCHADHDAGAFQKVMTGSRVAIITTPTIYKSFIRKYSALSGLKPNLLRHSHRHRPAIIGQPLRFQGAVFHFTYTLHTIPCISFKVEWRGRSIVFTGDHMNIPSEIDKLQDKGVLSKQRADDLRQLPVQDCDILLHEAGAPPIHTPLSVLQALPSEVRDRLYIVHTSAIPADCGLRVAPTGTAGTIRLDTVEKFASRMSMGDRSSVASAASSVRESDSTSNDVSESAKAVQKSSEPKRFSKTKTSTVGALMKRWARKSPKSSAQRKRQNEEESPGARLSDATNGSRPRTSDLTVTTSSRTRGSDVTVGSLRDGSNSNITLFGDYTPSAMSAFANLFMTKDGEMVVPPLVFSRPTCVSDSWFMLNLLSAVPFFSSLSYSHTMEVLEIAQVEIFRAGDVVLKGKKRSEVLCVFWEGVCIERIESDEDEDEEDQNIWFAGDWAGPKSLQPEASNTATQARDVIAISEEGVKVIILAMTDLQRILKSGSKLFRKYLSLQEKAKVQKVQSLDEATDAPEYAYGGHQPDKAFHESPVDILQCNSVLGRLTPLQKRHLESLAEGPRYFEADAFMWKVGDPVEFAFLVVSGSATLGQKASPQPVHYRRMSSAIIPGASVATMKDQMLTPSQDINEMVEPDKLLEDVKSNSEYARLEITLQLRLEEIEAAPGQLSTGSILHPGKESQQRASRDRFVNKVLARLYARRAYTSGLVFSKGMLLSDTSRMVSGDLANIHKTPGLSGVRGSIGSAGGTAEHHHNHTSNLVAGPEGCVVMVFTRTTLIPFLDSNPGVLLSLLGTQVVA